ncbi:DNA polymerase-3 subunit epsilon [Arachidicoccus rhizosphaerae]|uniref:DNA polymerase-3 subunit epsilon n=1 Tax=Arachidicoccus rhizosphaerae TaxID=551991 RepID=A0A1H4AEW9_9BACT|nr:3'-5' exonuclease [Arachidicoccus rhizosphaerae]SEA34281.1 DNA polymerase-3 subunit epsilon [Arachidicoccus rhizosphaerae]
MNITLNRPLAFFDIESTGVNPATDRIVELAIVRISPEAEKVRYRRLVNPGMPIPKESSDIHGITDEMVRDAPVFQQIAQEVADFLENCDLGGYNSNRFDVPLLVEEFLRTGVPFSLTGRRLLDVQKIYHKMEPRTLSAAYQFYCHKNLEDAHTATADVEATWEVLQAQIDKYPIIGDNLNSILQFTGEDKIVDMARRFVYKDEEIIFNFGKYKGKAAHLVFREEPQYYDWMMRGDFPLHTKQVVSEIFKQVFPGKK